MPQITLFSPPDSLVPSPTSLPLPQHCSWAPPQGPVPFPWLPVPSASQSLPGFAGLTPNTAPLVPVRAPHEAAAPLDPAAPGSRVASGQTGRKNSGAGSRHGSHQGCCGDSRCTPKYIPPPSVTSPGLTLLSSAPPAAASPHCLPLPPHF